MGSAKNGEQIRLEQRTSLYWRVTFDYPPLNIFGPETIPQLSEIVTALETDRDVKVVVFDSAVDGFFLTHYNFLAKLEDTTRLLPNAAGLSPLPDALVRLSRAPVVSIASIRGRATGVGSELALACDMRFASLERAILSQFEGWRWLCARRRTDGPIAAPHRPRTGFGSAARRRRHSWRSC
jgi:enoyl-CoA hydratase/carnithine racemase